VKPQQWEGTGPQWTVEP